MEFWQGFITVSLGIRLWGLGQPYIEGTVLGLRIISVLQPALLIESDKGPLVDESPSPYGRYWKSHVALRTSCLKN